MKNYSCVNPELLVVFYSILFYGFINLFTVKYIYIYIYISKGFEDIATILFLNKRDLFEEKYLVKKVIFFAQCAGWQFENQHQRYILTA